MCPLFKDKRKKMPTDKTLLNSSTEKRTRQARLSDILQEEKIPPIPSSPTVFMSVI